MMVENISQSFPLSENGISLIDDFAKAELLAKHLCTIIGVETYIPNRVQHEIYINQCLQEDSNLDINKEFVLDEMKVQINHLKKRKATGEDLIANELLLHLPENFQKEILKSFNRSWNESLDPAKWKLQLIMPVLKPNNDPKTPSSYKPISLTSCLGKLFERMLFARLNWWLESSSLLPDYQCGFRQGRSTTDNLL